MITSIFWIVPVASVLALVFAWFFFRQMMKESEGTETMAKIASYVREGAMSYLKQQYKVVASVFLVLVILFSIMGADRLPDRRFLLWTGGIPGDEDGDLCLRPYSQCRPFITQQGIAGRFPQRCRHGTGGGRPRTARHLFLVRPAERFHSR